MAALNWMPSYALLLVSLLVPAACASGSGSSTSTVRTTLAAPDQAPKVRQAEAALDDAVSVGAGLAVAVSVAGEPVWLAGAGWSDLDDERPVDPGRTRFRIYSLSKTLTAVTAARLMERGRLDPSGAIGSLLPDLPSHLRTITPLQLATHTAGIRHYSGPEEAANLRHCASVRDALELFVHDPLVDAPGRNESYSSWGYVLLSAALERASGRPYPRLVEDLVLDPLEMERTTIDDPAAPPEDLAAFYEEDAAGRLHAAPAVDNTCKWGAGAYVSTAEDMARFGSGLLAGGLLSAPSRALLMQGREMLRLQGVGTGGVAFLLVDPATGLVVVVLGNALGETAGPATQAAADAVYRIFSGQESSPQR